MNENEDIYNEVFESLIAKNVPNAVAIKHAMKAVDTVGKYSYDMELRTQQYLYKAMEEEKVFHNNTTVFPGDRIYISGCGGFAPYQGYETVTRVERRYDEISGSRYQLIFIGDRGKCYRGDNGKCQVGAMAYSFDLDEPIKRKRKCDKPKDSKQAEQIIDAMIEEAVK